MPVIIEKNIDDYEDFLELKDAKFQKEIKKSAREMQKGKFGTLDTLHAIHHRKEVYRGL